MRPTFLCGLLEKGVARVVIPSYISDISKAMGLLVLGRRPDMNKREIYNMGYRRGWNVASWQDMPEIGDELPRHLDWVGYGTVDHENQIDVWEMICGEAESSDRSFSPWDHTAHALNDIADSKPYDVWQVYDDAILAGIRAYRRKNYPKR